MGKNVGKDANVLLDKTNVNCIWVQGHYGDKSICPAYYAAQGICGSGGNEDCGGFAFELQCCNLSSVQENCQFVPGGYGQFASCTNGQIVGGGCGSGSKLDCGHSGISAASEALCCDYDGIILETSDDNTYTIKGGYGERESCPRGSIITAICGSGSKLDCGGYATKAVC